jgi:hypothetical protein
VRLVLGSLFCLALAAAIGLGLTWMSVNKGFTTGGLTIGAWTARPKSGTMDIDPYSRAVVERNGTLPIGIGDGVTFVARADDSNHPLDGRCDVVLDGTTPQARFFTLTLYSPDGKLISNALHRSGFTSQELIRNGDGSFRVSIGPHARPGNWLPTGGVEHYMIFLRLYDTSVGIQTRAGRETPMPTVTLGACR